MLRYSERPYKNYTKIKAFISEILHHYRFLFNKRTYVLCASAYTAVDHAQFGMYKNKMYRWGYFPKKIVYDINDVLSNKQKKKLLWVGRLLNWKHPEDAIKVALKLKKDGYDFSLNICGMGEEEERLRLMIKEYGLINCVTLLGAVSAEKVRKYMDNAGIFLFTSDYNEGWGAVLNESMNSGCAVVASHAIGSVPYLLKHKENGLIYHSGNIQELYESVKYLLDNPSEQEKMGKKAYETIVNDWNAHKAAERLVKLSEKLLAGEKSPNLYQNGPCSKAEVIKEDWINSLYKKG